MRIICLILLVVALLCSCDNDNDWLRKEVPNMAEKMVFFKHPRSGLCFAIMIYDGSASIANVPCNNVENLLVPAEKVPFCGCSSQKDFR